MEFEPEALKQRIRERAEERRKQLGPFPESLRAPAGAGHDPVANQPWSKIRVRVQQVDALAWVGQSLPSLSDRPPLRRAVAMRIAKLGRYLSRHLTDEQNRFNVAMSTALRALCSALSNEQEERLRRLEEAVADLRAQLRNQVEDQIVSPGNMGQQLPLPSGDDTPTAAVRERVA